MRMRLLASGAVALLLFTAPAGAGTSAARAFWTSLLLPGAGQYLNGHTAAGARFLGFEAALWGSYLGFRWVGNIREQNFRTHAAVHAGADPAGKSKQFFDDLGFYRSFHQHNRYAAVEEGASARLYPDTGGFFWEWDQEESRLRFRELRNAARGADRNAVMATSLVLANHLAAAVHAARRSTPPSEEGTAAAPADRTVELQLVVLPQVTAVNLIHRF